jgi:CelD/BcsL family acetyltransferase involved in cellulose biosynthesis
MLLPLSLTRRFGETTLSFVDAGLSDYVAPVLYPTQIAWTEENARALWEAIVSLLPKADTVHLEKLDRTVGGIVNPIYLVADRPNDEGAHGKDLTVSWDAIQTRFKRIMRKWRMLEKIGEVRFVVAQTPEERQRIFDKAIQQKRRRFDDTKVVGFEYYPERLAYFVRATERFAEAGVLQLCALTVDDEIVATSWSLGMGTRAYEIMIGFEAGEWTKHSCGRVLNLMHMRWLIDKGFTYLDHGIGDESWKLETCDTHIQLKQLLEIKTLRGRAMAGLRGAKQIIRANPVWKALRPVKFALEKRFAPKLR